MSKNIYNVFTLSENCSLISCFNFPTISFSNFNSFSIFSFSNFNFWQFDSIRLQVFSIFAYCSSCKLISETAMNDVCVPWLSFFETFFYKKRSVFYFNNRRYSNAITLFEFFWRSGMSLSDGKKSCTEPISGPNRYKVFWISLTNWWILGSPEKNSYKKRFF